jgi:hypothetical protein
MKKKSTLSFLSVFFGVFIHPRETTRKVIKNKYYSFIFPLIGFYCFVAGFEPQYIFELSEHLPLSVAIFIVLILMLGFGVGNFYIFAWLLYRIGKKLGGKGKLKEIQSAYALVYCPMYFLIFFMKIFQMDTWGKLFLGTANADDFLLASRVAAHPFMVLLFLPLTVWMVFLWIINISEAHKFSKWKALKTHLAVLGTLFSIVIVFLIFVFLIVFLIKLF